MASLVQVTINALVLLGVILMCHGDDSKTGEVKTESRQIFSPRMGKDVQVEADKDEEAGKHLYVRIPPLPKLGKTFDAYLNQYRRNDEEADDTNNFDEIPEDGEDNAAAGNEAKRGGVSMLRMGKRAGVSMLRMGKRAGVSMLRMGRRAGVSMLRMGKREDEGEFERDVRGGVSMLRMGRASATAGEEEKRGVSMLRMG